MIASSLLTPDDVVCARPTPTLSLFRELTLGSETGVFRWRDRKYGTVFQVPATPRKPNIEFVQFKRLLKAFLFGETAAH